ncbi:MAG: DUF6489 family protein [Rhizomicrobium sp.]
MKVNIELDMTPDEARRMMGLPDVTALQDRITAELERRMLAAMDAADPAAMMKAWFGGEGMQQFQRFWAEAAKPKAGKP